MKREDFNCRNKLQRFIISPTGIIVLCFCLYYFLGDNIISSLLTGKFTVPTYSIQELREIRDPDKLRIFKVEGYVVDISICGRCSPGKFCSLCIPGVGITSNGSERVNLQDNPEGSKNQMFIIHPFPYLLIKGKKYVFLMKIEDRFFQENSYHQQLMIGEFLDINLKPLWFR